MPLPQTQVMNDDKVGMQYSGFFRITADVSDVILDETSIIELFQTESLLSPSLETTVTIQSTIHNIPTVKNYDEFRNAALTIYSYNPNIDNGKIFTNTQTIYRLADRKAINYNVEEFVLHACDPTLIKNHMTRISQFYPCKTPTQVAEIAFNTIGAEFETEPSSPAKDYQATNLHPFQVLAEQADTALAQGADPSFLHFMTFKDGGTGIHQFKSLKKMTQQASKFTYVWSEKGFGIQLGYPHNIMYYEFPCDFDLLTDILNGIGPDGSNQTSVNTVNTFNGISSLLSELGGKLGLYGMGTSIVRNTQSDINNPDGCVTNVEKYASLRQARLSLIRPEDTALKLIVPYNGYLHAGDVITVKFPSKFTDDLDYGSGDYIIVTLTHNIKGGSGYGTTSLDLASKTIGEGLS